MTVYADVETWVSNDMMVFFFHFFSFHSSGVFLNSKNFTQVSRPVKILCKPPTTTSPPSHHHFPLHPHYPPLHQNLHPSPSIHLLRLRSNLGQSPHWEPSLHYCTNPCSAGWLPAPCGDRRSHCPNRRPQRQKL